MRVLTLGSVAAIVCVLAGSVLAGDAQTTAALAWTAYGRQATASNTAGTALAAGEVAGYRKRWSVAVGGMLTAQPLYVPAVKIAGKATPLVLVASANNSVVAIDPIRGKVVWRRTLGATKPQVCGGTGGVEATPAVDTAAGRIYVIGADGHVRALALATGKPVAGIDVPVIARTDVENVWGALRISAGRLYVPVSSWCDKGDQQGAWNGRIDAIDLKTWKIGAVLDVVPGPDNGGGVWGPGGVAVDPRDGSIWTATANAVVYANGNLNESAGLAERVVHLTPALKTLGSVRQPDTNESLLGDQGFGATPMLFQPNGCPPLLAVNSKSRYTYVWRRDDLQAAPLVRLLFGSDGTSTTFFAEPTWDAATKTLIVGGAQLGNGGSGAVGLRVGPGCTFTRVWGTAIGGGTQPQPLVAGRIVFVSATAVHELYAIDSATGRIVVGLDTGEAAYTAPMLAGNLVVVGSAGGAVEAFGPG